MLDEELNSVLMHGAYILISKWEGKWWSYASFCGAKLVFFFDEVQAIDDGTCPNLVFFN